MNLLETLLKLYWPLGSSIDDKRRMKEVVREIASTIRTWAPPKEQARICHLAINEIADRLMREVEK